MWAWSSTFLTNIKPKLFGNIWDTWCALSFIFIRRISIPNLFMPLTAPQLNVEEPEDTHSGDTNQALSKVFLEEVLPEKGPTTGGIHIALFGENFPSTPSTPLYVAFGDNWVRAVSYT